MTERIKVLQLSVQNIVFISIVIVTFGVFGVRCACVVNEQKILL